ncbi:HHIP-like protein 2 [Branchiostoma floridae x Branchiostoma belcheri]
MYMNAVLFLLVACAHATSGAKQCSTSATSSTPGCICLQEVVGGLKNPLAMLQPDDGTKRFFIVEQIGLIRVTDSSGRLLNEPFLNITSKVLTSDAFGDERGLLGAVLDPQFKQNGRFYVYYSTRQGAGNVGGGHKSVLARLQVSSDKNQADPSSERVLLEIAQPGKGNNGGQLMFGADGYLYVSVGDGGAGPHTAGNTSLLLGKILRINVTGSDSGLPYSIPADNPFVGQARPEVFAYGFKNPWRCSVDKGDKEGVGRGRVFCGDVGNSSYEEISIVSKGGNHGWPDREGHTCQDPSSCDDDHVPPIHVYSHDEGIAVIGGPVYRGCGIPSLTGKYLYADFTGHGKLFYLRELSNGSWTNAALCVGDNSVCKTSQQQAWGPGNFVLGFGLDVSGEAYLLTTRTPIASQPAGKVFKIVDPNSPVSAAPVLQMYVLLLLTALIMKNFI